MNDYNRGFEDGYKKSKEEIQIFVEKAEQLYDLLVCNNHKLHEEKELLCESLRKIKGINKEMKDLLL